MCATCIKSDDELNSLLTKALASGNSEELRKVLDLVALNDAIKYHEEMKDRPDANEVFRRFAAEAGYPLSDRELDIVAYFAYLIFIKFNLPINVTVGLVQHAMRGLCFLEEGKVEHDSEDKKKKDPWDDFPDFISKIVH